MGTDIHGVVQSGWKGGGWRNEVEIDDDRSYIRFAALAGVRNHYGITPISESRGLPEDSGVVDEGVRLSGKDVWMGDHSYSWLTLDEILEWDGWDQKIDEDGTLRDYCENFIRFIEWAKVKYSYGSDARIIFGFDS